MVAGIFELLHDQYKKDLEEGKKDSYRVGVTLGCTCEEEGGKEDKLGAGPLTRGQHQLQKCGGLD